jgi:hypothetical protein
VLLSVASNLYHPVPFDEWARRLRAANCQAVGQAGQAGQAAGQPPGQPPDCGAFEEIDNPSYVYARRRLLAEVLQNLRVEGVLIAPKTQTLDSASQRVEAVQELRGALSRAIEVNLDLVAEADSSLLILSVQDVDVAKIITASPESEEDAAVEDSLPGVVRGATVAGGVLLVLIALALALVFAPHVAARLLPRLPKHG